ncbi:MAG: guanylate kinase, partial [Acidobacteriaceae bacterium]|nr:guanylate kinase [Acidobacteriaceae bacterium]
MSNVFIISAPSGSGKSTLVARLLASDPDLRFSVSYTTRPARGAEVPGESYVFISREEFELRIRNGEFLEHAEVFGYLYGTHADVLQQAQSEHRDLILD